jgi:hypothetical protein
VRLFWKASFWLLLILGGATLSVAVQRTALHLGASDIEAMGFRGWINGATVMLGSWFVMSGMLPSSDQKANGT